MFSIAEVQEKSEMLFLKEDTDRINAEEADTNTLRRKHTGAKKKTQPCKTSNIRSTAPETCNRTE